MAFNGFLQRNTVMNHFDTGWVPETPVGAKITEIELSFITLGALIMQFSNKSEIHTYDLV